MKDSYEFAVIVEKYCLLLSCPFIYEPSALSPLLRLHTMNFRSKQDITKSNGFSLPLSRVLGHPPIVVLRFTYAATSLVGDQRRGLVAIGKDRDRFGRDTFGEQRGPRNSRNRHVVTNKFVTTWHAPYAAAFLLCLKNASKSALMWSGLVVHIPCGKPG